MKLIPKPKLTPVSRSRSERRRRSRQPCPCCRAVVDFCWTCPCGFTICHGCMTDNAWGMTCNLVTWTCPDCGATRSY